MRTLIGLVAGAALIAGCTGSPGSTAAGGSNAGSVPPASTPAVTAPPVSSNPTQAGPRDLPGDGVIVAGTYVVDRSLGMTIDIPPNWGACCGGAILKNDYAGLLLFVDVHDIVVYDDACKWESGGQTNPQGAEAIAVALSKQKHHMASEAKAATVAGVAGWVVRVQVPVDEPAVLDAENNYTFTECEQGHVVSFGSPADPLSRYHQGPGQIDDYYVIDIDGTPTIIDVVSGPDTPATDLAELEAMLASIRIP